MGGWEGLGGEGGCEGDWGRVACILLFLPNENHAQIISYKNRDAYISVHQHFFKPTKKVGNTHIYK